MSILDDFGELMGTPLVVQNPSTAAASVFGVKDVAAQGSTYMAHVLEGDGSNRRLAGIDENFSIIAWIASTSTGNITRASKITFPDGSHPPLKAVSYPRDEDGNVHHTKVVFG